MASSIKALNIASLHFDDSEKKELKRKLADTKKSLEVCSEAYLDASERLLKKSLKQAHTADALEDIKEHCQTSIALMDSMHDKLVDGFGSSEGITLSQAEVWKMMRSIIEVSDRLTDIHEDAVELREQ